MTYFNVNTDSLAAKSTDVQNTIARLQAEVNAMESGLRSLESEWQGQASQNFQQLVTDWRATQVKVEESLTSINQALTVATEQYTQAELSNARMFMH